MTERVNEIPTILITGAGRGLGLEFSRQYAAEGWRVIATCRDPSHARELSALAAGHDEVSVHGLDVSDFAAIETLAEELDGIAIDVALNNAGVFGPRDEADNDWRQDFGHIDYGVMEQVLRVNTFAPLRIAECFCRHVAASEQRKIVTISSSLGSISESVGGYYAYRVSKAAVNMLMATLARELSPQQIRIALLCPGWVRTDMGGDQAPLSPEDSVRGLREIIARLDDSLSGSFLRHDGTAIPW